MITNNTPIVKIKFNVEIVRPRLFTRGIDLRVWKTSPLETGLVNALLSTKDKVGKLSGSTEIVWARLKEEEEDHIFL